MRYPAAQLDGYDYISFAAFKYSARAAGGSLTGGSAFDRLSGGALGTVQLPMQPNLEEATGVEWGGDRLNEIFARLAEGAYNGIGAIADLDPGAAVGSVTDALGKLGNQITNDAGTLPFLKAYFAGQAVGANVTARATGQVINPNLELLFTGPLLRTFNFNFTLTPRDEGEADTVKNIIK